MLSSRRLPKKINNCRRACYYRENRVARSGFPVYFYELLEIIRIYGIIR